MEVAPLHCPHLYWKYLASRKDNEFTIIFDALIDNSFSVVLISKEHVSKLELHHKHLFKPYTAELTKQKNGHKVSIEFSKYVKIKVHNPSYFWSSKPVHMIIASSLCTPMILRLPFLIHT
jgi:hypothetical protein